jgi:aryl carrier-like protein
LVTSELDNEIVFEIIEQRLLELENVKEFTIQKLADTDNIISIYLDDTATMEWKALYKINNEYRLLLGGTFKIEILN